MKRFLALLWILTGVSLANNLSSIFILNEPVYVNQFNIYNYTHQIPTSRYVSPVGLINGTPNFPSAVKKSGKFLFVLSNGATAAHTISLYDADSLKHVYTLKAYKDYSDKGIPNQSFYNGLFVGPSTKHIYVTGGYSDNLLVFSLNDDKLSLVKSYNLKFYPFPKTQYPYYYQGTILNGHRLFYPDYVITDKEEKNAYVLGLLSNAIAKINLKTGKIKYQNVGSYPYQALLVGNKIIVSLWGDNKIAILNKNDLKLEKYIWVGYKTSPKNYKAGIHPTAMCKLNDDKIAIALTNIDKIALVNIKKDSVGYLDDAPFEGAKYGSYPDALACKNYKIFVANAGNNDIAVYDLKAKKFLGYIPTGWYPTSIYLGKNNLYIVSAKGLGSGPNVNGQWVGNMMHGLIQKVSLENFYKNHDYYTYIALRDDRFLLQQRQKIHNINKQLSSFLHKHIKYVVFILRENKTFDEDFGAYKKAGAWADPHLAFYTKKELPNLFNLADHYTLFANFYADGEVTAQGHQWTTGASDSDFVQKAWSMYYSHRGLVENPGWSDYIGQKRYDGGGWGSVGSGPDNPFVIYHDLKSLNGLYSNPWISYPGNLYLFNKLLKHHISFVDFGEFVSRNQEGDISDKMKKYLAYPYPGWDRMILDTYRAKKAINYLKKLQKEDKFPRFIYIWLPDDHTAGLNPCYYTPKYYVANNDHATGKFIDYLSHTPYYKHMLIMITEDDAQSGVDHIDAHRTLALAISPWVKRGYIDTKKYSQVDIVKTIELAFGLGPMSQWDQTAYGFYDIWTNKPNFKPIKVKPMEVKMSINPGSCSDDLKLRQKLGLKGEYLYQYKPKTSDLFTPTSLLKVSSKEQLKQIYIANKGILAYKKLMEYIKTLAKEKHAPISAFIGKDDD